MLAYNRLFDQILKDSRPFTEAGYPVYFCFYFFNFRAQHCSPMLLLFFFHTRRRVFRDFLTNHDINFLARQTSAFDFLRILKVEGIENA